MWAWYAGYPGENWICQKRPSKYSYPLLRHLKITENTIKKILSLSLLPLCNLEVICISCCCCCADFNAAYAHGGSVGCVTCMYMHIVWLITLIYTLCAIACPQAPPCPLYTQPRVRWVWNRCTNCLSIFLNHYENTPIQKYWNFYHQKMKIFR